MNNVRPTVCNLNSSITEILRNDRLQVLSTTIITHILIKVNEKMMIHFTILIMVYEFF